MTLAIIFALLVKIADRLCRSNKGGGPPMVVYSPHHNEIRVYFHNGKGPYRYETLVIRTDVELRELTNLLHKARYPVSVLVRSQYLVARTQLIG